MPRGLHKRTAKERSKANVGKSFVLDNSVVLAWYFADEADAYADRVAVSFSAAQAWVPGLWPLEVVNSLLTGERRKRSTKSQASAFIARLRDLPIVVDEHTATQAWSATADLARTCNLSAYDAAYLELALRNRVPLATLDEPLKMAAKNTGVAIYQP